MSRRGEAQGQVLNEAQEYIFEQANNYVAESIGVDPDAFKEAVKEGWQRNIFAKADLMKTFLDEQCEEALQQAACSAMGAGLDYVSDAAESVLVSAACELMQSSLEDLVDPWDPEATALKLTGVAIGSVAKLLSENCHFKGAQKTCVMNMTGQSILIKTYGEKDGVKVWAYGRWPVANGQTECIEAPPGQKFTLAIWVGSELEVRHYFEAECSKLMYYCVTPADCLNIPLKLDAPTPSKPKERIRAVSPLDFYVESLEFDCKDASVPFHYSGLFIPVGYEMSEEEKAREAAAWAAYYEDLAKKPENRKGVRKPY